MLKIVVLVLVCAVLVVFLKNVNSEIYPLALLGSGIIVLYAVLNYITETIGFFEKLLSVTSINEEYMRVIYKIIAIGYIVEFGAGTVEDMGIKSLSDKLIFIGKIIIIGVSVPVFYGVFEMINGLL